MRITSSHHGPYDMGYTCVTLVITKGSYGMKPALFLKNYYSSDCFLKLENMKLESRVIADQHAAVKIR
jgi:hypothetical protein